MSIGPLDPTLHLFTFFSVTQEISQHPLTTAARSYYIIYRQTLLFPQMPMARISSAPSQLGFSRTPTRLPVRAFGRSGRAGQGVTLQGSVRAGRGTGGDTAGEREGRAGGGKGVTLPGSVRTGRGWEGVLERVYRAVWAVYLSNCIKVTVILITRFLIKLY